MSRDDKYTCPNSGGVLRNKLGITDGRHMDEAMNELASAVWSAISVERTPAAFDSVYLQHIVLFCNLGTMLPIRVIEGSQE